MKEVALKVGREVVKIIRYLSLVGIILMGFGIFAVFFARQITVAYLLWIMVIKVSKSLSRFRLLS